MEEAALEQAEHKAWGWGMSMDRRRANLKAVSQHIDSLHSCEWICLHCPACMSPDVVPVQLYGDVEPVSACLYCGALYALDWGSHERDTLAIPNMREIRTDEVDL